MVISPVSARTNGEPSGSIPTTKGELGDTAPQRPHEEPSAKPKSFMTSSWHPGTSWYNHLFPNPLQAILYAVQFTGPADPREGKVPIHTVLSQHLFIFPRTLPPIAYQYYCYTVKGETWHPAWALFIYTTWYTIFSLETLFHLNRLVYKYGALDGKIARDQVPDKRVTNTVFTLAGYAFVRPLIPIVMLFDRNEVPHISPYVFVHAFFISIIVDLYFYIYHRSVHEVDSLWRFHKTHHMSKHPSSVLSAFADPEQEFTEIVLVPMLTCLTYKVDFFSWWIASIYIIYVEAAGHSGTRLHMAHPVSSPILRWFDMDLMVEDHDLHHRQGWRKSTNYGKQSRVWDKLFGTTRPRVECTKENEKDYITTDWVDILY